MNAWSFEQMTASYVKRPVVIQAVRWSGENDDRIKGFVGIVAKDFDDRPVPAWRRTDRQGAEVYDKIHNAWIPMAVGMWVLRGVRGEFYPIADEVFRETYDPAPVPET